MAAPPSQKADKRPMSFVLSNSFKGTTKKVDLVVRPEDLMRNEPALQTTTQTFGGAWIDDFGRGVQTIQISGHTGWRTGPGWEAAFKELRDNVWVQWHDQRKEAIDAGQDPDKVQLIFVDTLDDIVAVVAPSLCSLKRNKSSPLLMRYAISMTVLSDTLAKKTLDELAALSGELDAQQAALNKASGIESLQGSLDKITAKAASVRGYIDSNIAAPIKNFMALSTNAFQQVLNVTNTVTGLVSAEADQLIGIAQDIALVGRNAFYTYNAVVGLPTAIQHELSEVAAAYENAFCVLNNVFKRARQYPDYSDLYGASNCSSTVGGSPLSPIRGTNAFEVVLPSVTLPPSVTASAKSDIEAMKSTDPVLNPMGVADMALRLGSIADGVVY